MMFSLGIARGYSRSYIYFSNRWLDNIGKFGVLNGLRDRNGHLGLETLSICRL